MSTKVQATIEDLYKLPDHAKAEIVDGEIVVMAPTGYLPGYAGGEIFASLREHGRRTKTGMATPDNVGYRVKLPNREWFSPDAAFYVGQPTGMKFLEGAPEFAVEVRSENDYGAEAEAAIARKGADYFAAGTLGIWDVLDRTVFANTQSCWPTTNAKSAILSVWASGIEQMLVESGPYKRRR